MKRPGFYTTGKKRPDFIAGYDSATAMFTSLSNYLKGKDFKGTGSMPSSEFLAKIVDTIPPHWKEKIYSASGPLDAVRPSHIQDIDTTQFDKWVTNNYPDKKYPAIAVGSSNGAMVHLLAAMGIPWLPQTFLIPVQKPHIHKDAPKKTMEWAVPYAEQLLHNNPDVQLHHMTDPNQDRLHLDYITYFRTKKLTLGVVYEQFIREHLLPGGTLLVIDCEYGWPTVNMGDRHVFQFGGSGGLKPDEYYHPGQKVVDFLKEQQSPYYSWDAPVPDKESPEAEWGFAKEMLTDIHQFAQQEHFGVEKITFDDPHHASDLVADIYRYWYQQRNIPANRLLVECFALHEPYWSLKTGVIPYWMIFNTKDSANAFESYLQKEPLYDEIYMMLLSHGADSIGLSDIAHWKNLLQYAKKKGTFLGMKPEKYPRDFGVYLRYNKAIRTEIPSRYPTISPMHLSFVHEFMKTQGKNYRVQWQVDSLQTTRAIQQEVHEETVAE